MFGRLAALSVLLGTTQTEKTATTPQNFITVGPYICFYLNTKIEAVPLYSFTVPDVLTCQEYCHYMPSCAIFTFSLYGHTPTCTTFPGSVTTKHGRFDIGSVTVEKDCLEIQARCDRSNSAVVEQGGVYLRDLYITKCLAGADEPGADEPGAEEPGADERRALQWKACRDADVWRMQSVDNQDDTYRIERMYSDECLTWRVWTDGRMKLASLSTCNSSSPAQLFKITPGMNEGDCDWSITNPANYYIFIQVEQDNSIDDRKTLMSMSLVPAVSYDIPCSKFKVPHGAVLNEPSLPFYLPGADILVRCDPGYGIKLNHTYNPQLHVTCSRNLTKPVCSKITHSVPDLYRVLLLILAPLGVVCVLAEGAVIYVCSQKLSHERRKKKEMKYGAGTMRASAHTNSR